MECRQKLESSQKRVEPVPLIGFLTGFFALKIFITFTRLLLIIDFFLRCVLYLQRKLWSFWWELSHGTLTYRDLEWLVRSSKARAKIRRESFSLCKKWRLLLQLGPYNHIKDVV